MRLGGVLWGVVWPWVVLGEVLGGFWRPARFRGRTTLEGQGLPRGVRGARGAQEASRSGFQDRPHFWTIFRMIFDQFLVPKIKAQTNKT